MASQPNHSATHSRSKSTGSSAHPGTPVENERYQFEWITSECEDTGNLIDELRIISNEDDAAFSEPYTYCTHNQDLTSSRKRRVVHPTDRILGNQATTASATAICESLALQGTSSSNTANSEQYDFFQRYETNWDTRSITDCEAVEFIILLPELDKTDSGYESYVEDGNNKKMGFSLCSLSKGSARSATLSDASTLANSPTSSRKTSSSRACNINLSMSEQEQEEYLWRTHIPARDSLDLDRNGLRLCDGERISMRSNTSFEVLDVRLPQECWIPHRNSLDRDRNGNRLCAVRGSALVRERDKKDGGKLRPSWLKKLKNRVCGKCADGRVMDRVMVNYL